MKKEEKDRLKKTTKRRKTRAVFQRTSRERKKQAQKAKQAEKNPYSLLAEKEEGEVMDDDSVVFTEPPSSNHLPKGTLSRLPLT